MELETPVHTTAMKPEDVLKVIAANRGTAICIPTMTTSPSWRTIAPDDLSIGCVGFMGGRRRSASGSPSAARTAA